MTLLLCLAIAAIFCMDSRQIAILQHEPGRIVSFAPGITESLYALGLGEKVAGVTSFCAWPPQAKLKPAVAGFRDINLEAVARTGADLAILPDDMVHYRKLLENLGIAVITFEGRTLAGFLRDLRNLGSACGVPGKADALAAAFRKGLKDDGNNSGEKPAVLFALMNPDECSRPISELTILGDDGFYSELIRAAGGRNAYEGHIPYPRLSREAIIALNPDLIVVAVPECPDRMAVEKNWRNVVPGMGNVNDHLLLLEDAGDTVPGPRSLATLRKLAKTIKRQSQSRP